MDVSYIIEPLNDAQREAVTASPEPLLVLAGAGSGKTRVLVHRVAWLVQVEGLSPYGILAVTFTNKAAGEMRSRIEKLIGVPTRGMWVGTFHGLAHRLLRAHWKQADLPQTFQVLDSDDDELVANGVAGMIMLGQMEDVPRLRQVHRRHRANREIRFGVANAVLTILGEADQRVFNRTLEDIRTSFADRDLWADIWTILENEFGPTRHPVH